MRQERPGDLIWIDILNNVSFLLLVASYFGRKCKHKLLERNKFSTSKTGTAVGHRSVGDGIFTEVGADHLRLDLYCVEDLAVVHTNDRANHFRHDDHVTQMRAYRFWLLAASRFFFSLAELFHELHRLASKSTLEASADASSEKINKSFGLQIKQLVKINPSVTEFAESALLRRRSNESVFFILFNGHKVVEAG